MTYIAIFIRANNKSAHAEMYACIANHDCINDNRKMLYTIYTRLTLSIIHENEEKVK